MRYFFHSVIKSRTKMITYSDLEKADISDLPIRTRVEAFFKGTDAISKFVESELIPLLGGLIKLNDKEKAIFGTYLRMYTYLRSMVAMNSGIHFQGAASATRSLFELFVDIKILAGDRTGEFVEKYHAFPDVIKYRVAEQIVSFCESNKGNISLDYSVPKNFINQSGIKNQIEQTVIKHWGKDKKGNPRFPEHWSGQDIRKRAHDLGIKYEELYLSVFKYLSWHIHSGSANYAGLDIDQIEACFGFCHSKAQQIFLEATVICAQELKITNALDWFYHAINELQLTPGKVLVNEQIKYLENLKLKGGN